MPVSYTAKATRLTDPDGSGAASARTPNAGEPAADFNDLDTAMAAVVALANANETAVAGKANASHTHAAADVTSGVLNPARLGSGTANTTTYLRGDGTWAAVAGGGGTPADATTTTKGIVQLAGDLGGTAAAPTVPGLAGKANTSHTHAAADTTSGTFATARLGSGTANSTTYLRGDGTWAAVSAGSSTLTVRTVTAATTLAGTDQYLRVNASSGVTVTVPTGLTTGSVFEVRQVGAGQVTIAGAGVTFTPSTELKTAGQHTSVRLIVTGTNAVDVDGGVA